MQVVDDLAWVADVHPDLAVGVGRDVAANGRGTPDVPLDQHAANGRVRATSNGAADDDRLPEHLEFATRLVADRCHPGFALL